MNRIGYVKTFIAGMVFPGTVLPFVLLTIWYLGRINILETLPVYLVPIVWGIWNILYVAIGNHCPIKRENLRLLVTGATLGFLIASIGVFLFDVIDVLFSVRGFITYVPLFMAPLIYAILWRYVVKYINKEVVK